MKTLNTKLTLGSLLLGTTLATNVYALPMFERQTGLSCAACHYQQQPKLSPYGRDFLLSGMTLSDKVADEEGNDSNIQASIMFKSRYEKTDDAPNSQGEVSVDSPLNDGLSAIPKTASVYVGGRINENFGTLVSASYKDEEDHNIAGRVMYSKEIENGYYGVSMYSYKNFGPYSGIELYNTGLYKPTRTFDSMKLTNINQATKIGSGSATGFQAFYAKDSILGETDRFFTSLGAYTPAQDNADFDMASNFIPIARVAYEYEVGNFNLIFGGFALVGGSETNSADRNISMERETYGVDFQVEGTVLEKEVSLIITKVIKNDVDYTGFGSGSDDFEDIIGKGYSVEAEVNITEDIGLKLAYLEYDDLYTYPENSNDHGDNSHIDVKDIDNAISIGVDYSFDIGTPMKLALEHTWAKPSLDRVEDYKSFVVTLNMLF